MYLNTFAFEFLNHQMLDYTDRKKLFSPSKFISLEKQISWFYKHVKYKIVVHIIHLPTISIN